MHFERLTSSDQVWSLIDWHNRNSKYVVIDVETTSVHARTCELIDIQLTGRDENSVVVFSRDAAHLLRGLSKSITLVAHNYKYDAHVLYRAGIDLLDFTWRDTLLLSHLSNENRESYSLDSHVKEIWNDPYKEEFWTKYSSYQEAPTEAATEYGCKDVYYTRRLYDMLIRDLQTQQIPDSLIAHVHRLQDSLLRTEIKGIKVDTEYLTELGVKLKRRIDELNPQMRSLVEDEIQTIELELWQKELDKRKTPKGKAAVSRPVFNFESSAQLSSLLYSRLCLPVQRNQKTKAISTDFDSLERIKENHPVVGLIQENRDLQKVYTSYVEGTIDRLDQERIYPEFRVAGTVTGRVSHSNPNLAQLPTTGGVRGIYVPDPGRVLISADYSQLEVVLEANLTSDKNLIRMLENGESKHDLTSRELGCDRPTAKTLNFALQYWASHFKVAKLLGCGIPEALRIYNKYWEVYSGAKALKAKTDKMVDDGIPIVNMFGRKRRFGVRFRHPWDKDYRMAYNFLIQSTGADITSEAFYKIAELLAGRSRALFTVHDEILIECLQEHAEQCSDLLLDEMVDVGHRLNLQIHLQAVSSGPMKRWED